MIRLLAGQFRAQNRIFWRVPVGAFFTLVLPVVMLVLFVALFGNDSGQFIGDDEVTTANFYAPGLAVFSAASATYTNIGINLTIKREDGILKRVRGTPLPPGVYMGGVVMSAVWIALIGTVLMIGLGVVAYGVDLEPAMIPAMLVTFVVGSVSFAILGVALASLAPSSSAAPAMANATIIPLAFVSSVFISFDEDIPRWLEVVGDVFPLKPFAVSFQEAMNPFNDHPVFEWERLAVIVAWGAVGALVAARKFRWEPVPGRASTTRSSRRRDR